MTAVGLPVEPNALASAEAAVFHDARAHGRGIDTGIFILGSPRSGSTVLYQLLARAFRMPFISNFTNTHFAAHPILGIALQAALEPWDRLSDESTYGKTKGDHEPHEGSAILSRWFGGGHPSQVVSASIKPGQEPHMRSTLIAVHSIFGRPLLIKNAWNCFRVRYLATAFPYAQFVWIRRDIGEAARSDLHARYVTKGSPNKWNSATPANVELLRTLPYTAQVIENQFEFNEAIGKELAAHAPGRFAEIWYDQMCDAPLATLIALASQLNLVADRIALPPNFKLKPGESAAKLSDEENLQIEAYLALNAARLRDHMRGSKNHFGAGA